MCTKTIIDASVFGKFDAPQMRPFWNWMNNGHGILIYTDGGKYDKELRERAPTAYRRLTAYRQSGQFRLVKWDQVREYELALNRSSLRSNDPHVIALARASDALVLCSCDGDLKRDFVNRALLPHVNRRQRAVYPSGDRKKQREFLHRRKCPARQGRASRGSQRGG